MMEQNTVYWTVVSYGKWQIHIAAVSSGLCFIGSNNGVYSELSSWLDKKLPNYDIVKEDDKLNSYHSQLIAYFNGGLDGFTFPVELHGTPFQLSVWKELCSIPYGQTQTYSHIALSIGRPKAVRAVAAAIGANPLLISIPCHRVVGKNGKLTGYRGGLAMKQQLLMHEKV